MVARVAIEEGEQDATSRRVDDLVDAWEREGVLWEMFIEISIIHTHCYSFSRLVQG
jgi:aminopeptidase C